MRGIFNAIAKRTNVYVFSGMIRNFFLGVSCYRDLDIVVDSTCVVLDILRNTEDEINVRINSFGGIKIRMQNLTIDLWELSNTWGIRNGNMPLSPQSLLKSAFFNFSAIVFAFNETKFYYDDAFVDFLETRIMDVVYPENPNVPLCIINTLYYREKYGFGVAIRMSQWIVEKYTSLKHNNKCKNIFDNVQMLHFSKIIVSYDDIKDFILLCFMHCKNRRPIYPKYI